MVIVFKLNLNIALKAGCRGVESPIIFEDRRVGQSKMKFEDCS